MPYSWSNPSPSDANGISGGYHAYEQNQQQGQADDAANAAIYGSRYSSAKWEISLEVEVYSKLLEVVN
jgi:hypothetical protein